MSEINYGEKELKLLEEKQKELSLIVMNKEKEKYNIAKKIDDLAIEINKMNTEKEKIIIKITKKGKTLCILTPLIIMLPILVVECIYILNNLLSIYFLTSLIPIYLITYSISKPTLEKNIIKRIYKMTTNKEFYQRITKKITEKEKELEKNIKLQDTLAEEYLQSVLNYSTQNALIKIKKENINPIEVEKQEVKESYVKVKKI